LRREPKRDVDAGERSVRFDSFSCSFLYAWTGRFGIAVEKLDLAQRSSWIITGPILDVGRIRTGKNRSGQAQDDDDGNATREREKRALLRA
jgi:hypothetical protein